VARYTRLGLPKLLDAGMKAVYLANHFENNMNTWGVGNMCCTVDYKVAESVGVDHVREFCRQAQAGGARVYMWGNTSISAMTQLLNWHNGKEDRIRFLPREGAIMEALKPSKAPFVRVPPPLTPEEVTSATLILGTHDHADHIDRAAWSGMAKASPEAVFVVPDAASTKESGRCCGGGILGWRFCRSTGATRNGWRPVASAT
jgi:hypothetical protein